MCTSFLCGIYRGENTRRRIDSGVEVMLACTLSLDQLRWSDGSRSCRYVKNAIEARTSGRPGKPADSKSGIYPRRWRTISYKHTPVATETLRLDTLPAIGSFTSSSQFSRVRRRIPFPSAPITSAVGPVSLAS